MDTIIKIVGWGGLAFVAFAIWRLHQPAKPESLSFKERAAKRAAERLNKSQRN